jgi:hypothetical protein
MPIDVESFDLDDKPFGKLKEFLTGAEIPDDVLHATLIKMTLEMFDAFERGGINPRLLHSALLNILANYSACHCKPEHFETMKAETCKGVDELLGNAFAHQYPSGAGTA